VDFYTFCPTGNRNEYSTEELQNLQLCPNCVSTLPETRSSAIALTADRTACSSTIG